MAAARICLCGCGREIPRSARPHKTTVDGTCRKRLHDSRHATVRASILEHEDLAVALAREGKISPEDAILWVVCPDQMRATVDYVQVAV